LGACAVYPIDETEIVAPDIAIPEHWPLAYGMDVGWNRTTVVWGAPDPAREVVYQYSETLPGPRRAGFARPGDPRQGRVDPGGDLPGVFGSSQVAGRPLMEVYRKLGLHLGAGGECGGGGDH